MQSHQRGTVSTERQRKMSGVGEDSTVGEFTKINFNAYKENILKKKKKTLLTSHFQENGNSREV